MAPIAIAVWVALAASPAYAQTPVPYSQLQLDSPNVTWLDGPTTGSPGKTCDSYPAGNPELTTMSLSGDPSGNALIAFDSGSQGPPAAFISNPVPVDQAGNGSLQFGMSGGGPPSGATFTDTFRGYGTSFTGTLTEVLSGAGGTCTWTTPVTLTFAGTGLTLVPASTPQPPTTTTSSGPPPTTTSSPPPKAGSSVNVICNYQFQSGLEVCGATVGGGAAGPPTGSVSFGTGTAGGFPSGSQCTLSRTPNSDTSSCTVSFKPASNNLTKITSLVMSAGYSGDSNYQGATGQTGTKVMLAASGQLQTTTNIDINTTLTDGGLNFPFENPIQNGIFKGSLADESGSLATGGAVNVNLARRLKGKLIIASLKRKLGPAGTYNLRIKLTPQGRKQLKLLKKHHKTTLKVILTITDKRAKKHKHAPNAAALINTLW